MEAQLREHDASKQAVAELLKFAQNEADSIMSKIKDQVNTCNNVIYSAASGNHLFDVFFMEEKSCPKATKFMIKKVQ